jgi:mycofactocin system FadH/OYE family oxidoreductase 1
VAHVAPVGQDVVVNLLKPLALNRSGTKSAPSRVMFGPMETNLGSDRAFTEQHGAFYSRRARGGAGIIVIEEAAVHASDWAYERSPLASRCGPGWRSIADAIRKVELRDPTAKPIVLAALGHNGGQGTSHWSQGVMWAPSAIPEVATREVPKVMEHSDIAEVIAGFGAAAALAVASGLDGVEINIGQFSLIRQFISGLTNLRSDEYGTDRLRFAREVLTSVRAAIGDECVLGIRLCVDELAPWAGIVPEAGAQLAVDLSSFADYFTVVRGSIYTTWATQPDQHVEPGFGIAHARLTRETLRNAGIDRPVFAQGSIIEWGQAEWAIDSGAADGIEMTRAQLADADLVNKVRDQLFAHIRPCLLCNQTCKVRDNRSPVITCVVDPRTGHETQDPEIPLIAKSSNDRHLAIVGGGVAGMEAARIGALQGYAVTLYEATESLGGATTIAAKASGRDRLQAIVTWLMHELETLGVRIECNRSISDAQLQDLHAKGHVVLATGGSPGPLPFDVKDGAHILHAYEWLQSNDLAVGYPEGPVAVWDPIGGSIGISCAETLAQLGREVTLITPDLLVGEKLSLTGDLAPAQNRLHGAKITLKKRVLIRVVTSNGIEVEDRFSGEVSTVVATTLIACGHRLPNTTLDLDEQSVQIGDRVAPRTIHESILEARRVVLAFH